MGQSIMTQNIRHKRHRPHERTYLWWKGALASLDVLGDGRKWKLDLAWRPQQHRLRGRLFLFLVERLDRWRQWQKTKLSQDQAHGELRVV